MSYCEADEVINMIKDSVINNIIGDDIYIEDINEKKEKVRPLVEQAILDADAEINGYLMKRYSLPFEGSAATNVLNKFSKDIVLYNLMSRSGIDEGERENNYLTRYKTAITFLTNVAKGVIDIGSKDIKVSASSGFKMNSSSRLFSRNSLRGM